MIYDSNFVRELGILKHSRVVRRWAARYYGLSEIEIEMLYHLHTLGIFTNQDIMESSYTLAWNSGRMTSLIEKGFIKQINRGRGAGNKSRYKFTTKGDNMMNRIYRILLGQEKVEMNEANPFFKAKSYTDKTMLTMLDKINKENKQKQKK